MPHTHIIKGLDKKINLKTWKRDYHDHRDKLLMKNKTDLLHLSPPVVDNSSFCSEIEDQGELGSCTAHMATSIIEYNDNRFGAKKGYTNLSRLFQYYITREIENSVAEDSGATIRDSIKAMAQSGTIDEKLWVYDISKFAVKPPNVDYANAKLHKITDYYRIPDGDVSTMKSALASCFVIGFGMLTFSSFLSVNTAKTGIATLPGTKDSVEGGHAVVIVGYDDRMVIKNPGNKTTTGAFKIRNSWGKGWGKQGYFWLPYDFIKNTNYANDFWVVRSVLER